MEDKLKLKPEEFQNLIQDAATIASASKIYYDGIQYIDNASFWEWITQSYKNSQYIDSAESMKQFINLHGNQLKGIQLHFPHFDGQIEKRNFVEKGIQNYGLKKD